MRLQIRRGATLLDPIPIGRRANGTIAHEIVATRTGGVHKLVSGMTGAGKSWGEKPVLLTCGALQADIIVMDPVKGVQSFASIAGALRMYEVDPGRCRTLINRLVSHTLPARTNRLAGEGLTEWDPRRSSLRFLIVHIEEAWKLAGLDALVGLGNAIRSAGGRLVHSLQQPTWDQMPTVLRNQMGAFRAYGLADRDYNEFSLPDTVVAAGANPAQWLNEDPGMHYCVMPGDSMKDKTSPVRAWADGDGGNTFADAAAYVAARMGPVCQVTAESLGELWATHIPPLELVKQIGHVTAGPARRAALTVVTSTPDGPDDDRDDDDLGTPAATMPAGANDDEHDEVDPDTLHDPEYQAAVAEFESLFDGIDPDDVNAEDLDDENAVTIEEDDEGNIVIIDPDGNEFVINDEEASEIDELVDGPPDPDVRRLIGDPPKEGVTREEFRELIEARVQTFLADREAHVLERRAFVKACADCGWSMASVYKYLNRHPQIVKADRGWIRVAGDEAA